MAALPVPFDPSMEQIEPDERETVEALLDAMRGIMETTAADHGRGVRAVHAKSHGLLVGELQVLDALPPELSQGVFAIPGAGYRTVMRFSTNPGDILDDSITVPRGLAIKLLGVDGERLPGSEHASTQDFVMAAAPAFAAADTKQFLRSLRLLARTTDTPQVLKKALSAVLRGAETALELVGGESATLKAFGGARSSDILGETFWSQAPMLWGPYVAKLSVAPLSPNLVALANRTVNPLFHANVIRDTVRAFFAREGAEWEVRCQLMTDRDAMPVEDASVAWPEDRSPYAPVARIVVPKQDTWSQARQTAFDDGLAFSPWHGLAAHRPLGSVMRARKPAYEMSAGFRAERNGCPIHEPRRDEVLPA